MDSTNSQGTDSSKQPNIKSPQSIFHRIWYPTQDDILKLGMFFTASLIAGIMILSPILRLLGNNQTLTYILLSFFLLLVVLLVTMAIRIQITRSSNIDSTSNKFFSKLPDKHRKKFFMGAFVYMPIGCL
ncbi:MAG: hypothetical protein GY931_10040, partial [Maribacter sp.]|nr:hypothetical protein [Maribacter sp.]